jgi:hypothetical protein
MAIALVNCLFDRGRVVVATVPELDRLGKRVHIAVDAVKLPYPNY